MDFKRNLLFFNHKKTQMWTYVSYASYLFFAIAVAVFLMIGWLPPALPFACVGVVILLTALSMMTSEKHIKQEIELLRKNAKEEALEYFGYPDQNPDLFFEFEGYDLFDDSLTLRKNKNGRVFTTKYGITYFMIEKDSLKIWEKYSSLVDDDSKVLERTIPITELQGASLVNETVKRMTIDGKEKDVTRFGIRVTDLGGNDICTAGCLVYDYAMEKFAQTLGHYIERASSK